MTDLTPTGLTDLAAQELSSATTEIVAGDENLARYAQNIRQAIEKVSRLSLDARNKAAALRDDDVSNPAGIARQLSEIPAALRAATDKVLQEAGDAVDVLEGRHRNELLRHDPRNDFALINELNNFTVNLSREEAAGRLAELAGNPRYATLMAGPMGLSLAARFGLKDASGLTRAAVQGLATNGSASQRARAAALDKIDDVRRVVGLARGARDAAAEETQRPPTPRPSQALMS